MTPQKFKVITGTAMEVEDAVNLLSEIWLLKVKGLSATNESTTVIVELIIQL